MKWVQNETIGAPEVVKHDVKHVWFFETGEILYGHDKNRSRIGQVLL